MSEHTPGPWKWFNYPDGRKLLSGSNRAVIHCPDAPLGVTPDDRALIAAAPELLEAAKHAAMEWRLHGQLTDSCRVLEAAIAKAESRDHPPVRGEEP